MAQSAAPTTAQRAGWGSGARVNDPATTRTVAVIMPPTTSPTPKATAGVPRQTGELSTEAEFRLQVEPLVAYAAVAPVNSQAPSVSHPDPVATPAPATANAAAVRAPATGTGCHRSRRGRAEAPVATGDPGQEERQMVRKVWPR
jgi:hypothetical protein